jgi:hypothetical protein
MATQKVIIDYSKDTDFELDVFAQNVYTSLNPNPNFTWDEPIMLKFHADIAAYRNALEKVQNGTSADTIAKNTVRAALIEDLKKNAAEVNLQAGYDLQKLQSSGLRLAKGKTKVGVLPKPTGFAVKSGDNSGDLLCSVDRHPQALVYNFYSAPVPAPANIDDWRLTPSTTHKKNIQGFIPGKQYELKCAYLGSEEELVYSDPVSIYAQ